MKKIVLIIICLFLMGCVANNQVTITQDIKYTYESAIDPIDVLNWDIVHEFLSQTDRCFIALNPDKESNIPIAVEKFNMVYGVAEKLTYLQDGKVFYFVFDFDNNKYIPKTLKPKQTKQIKDILQPFLGKRNI